MHSPTYQGQKQVSRIPVDDFFVFRTWIVDSIGKLESVNSRWIMIIKYLPDHSTATD